MSSFRSLFLALIVLTAVLRPLPAAASIESELNNRWRGAWTIVELEALSDCGGNYTNNEVRERRVTSKGDFRFAPGELATVYKINLKRKRVDVLLDLAEPLLVEFQEGPFTLYELRDCKVELQISLPRGAASGPIEQLDELLAGRLERHDDRGAAETAAAWNRRVREEFPEDYDETLAEYERWRVEHTNAEIAATLEHHVEEAARLVDRLDDDADYLDGFAAGVDRARDAGFDWTCERLLSERASSFVRSAPRGNEKDYSNGYREGQELLFFLEVARRLPRCFLPPELLEAPIGTARSIARSWRHSRT